MRSGRGQVYLDGRPPRARVLGRATAALGLASLLAGVGCNTVLGIDEAELCSEPTCDTVPDFVQDRTQANMPAPGGRDAGVGDAGAGIGGPGLVVPAPGSVPSAGGSGGSGGSSPAPGAGTETEGGDGNEAPGSNASLPDDIDSPGDDGSGSNSGSDNSGSGDGSGNSGSGNDNGNSGNGNGNSGNGNGNGNGNGGGSAGAGAGGSGDGGGGGGTAGAGSEPVTPPPVEPAPVEPPPVEPPPPPPPPPTTACTGRAPGEIFCDGTARVTCGLDGSVTSSDPCVSAEHCAQGVGPNCAICLLGEAVCDGATLLSCNATQSALESQDCLNPALCNAVAARCEPAACQPNAVSCAGSVLQVCNATSTGFDPMIDCGAPEACNATSGSCNVCTPGARRCLDGATVLTCDPTGQVETPSSCGLLEVCDGGECELLGLGL